MSLPTYEEALKTARDGSAFSNGTEWLAWSGRWCERCLNDTPELVAKGEGCPLVAIVMLDQRTPAEWVPDKPSHLGEQYRCIYFRGEDDGPDPEPTPIPDPPGQLGLFPRGPFEGTRILTRYPQPAEVA